MRFAHWRKDKVPIRAEVRTLKDVAPSNFSSTPLPERNRGNSYRESGLFCQQFILAIHFGDSFFSLRQPSNPQLLAHDTCYAPPLCEIKQQTLSNGTATAHTRFNRVFTDLGAAINFSICWGLHSNR